MNTPFIEFGGKREKAVKNIFIHRGKTDIGNRICIPDKNKPFFSIPNANGTVKSFLEALNNNYIDEAMGYISKNVISPINFSDIYSIFEGVKSYKCLISVTKNTSLLKQVSIAVKKSSKNRIEIINLKMVNEPDSFGKWKIYQIEKE